MQALFHYLEGDGFPEALTKFSHRFTTSSGVHGTIYNIIIKKSAHTDLGALARAVSEILARKQETIQQGMD